MLQTTTTINIKINGAPLPQTTLDDVVDLSVDSDLYLPTMFSFSLQESVYSISTKLKYIDGTDFTIGKSIEILIKDTSLIKGEITSLEPIFLDNGLTMLRVRGYDRSHKLTHKTMTRTFQQVTGQAIISKIAQENGLSVEVDSGGMMSQTYEFFMQYNQTDWDFLWAQARLGGYQVYVDDRKLCFKKLTSVRGAGLNFDLEWGSTLSSFEPRVSLMNQVGGVAVHGWDADTKKAIASTVTSAVVADISPDLSVTPATGIAAANQAIGANTLEVITDQPVGSAGMAKAIAEGELANRASGYIRANGYCAIGDPHILAGKKVNIKQVGTKYSGSYTVTKAVHQYTAGHYTVRFSLSGNISNSLFSILSNDGEPETNKINGIVSALVTDINDPKKLGRIKVTYPWLPKVNGADISSGWVRVATPSGGKERGFYFAPEVDDEVLVAFEHGDPNYPIVVGSMWNNVDKPPAGTAQIINGGKVNQRVIRSRSGHLIILDDTKGSEKIVIQDSTGDHSITMDGKNKNITLKSKGDFIIETDGKFSVTSKGNIVMETQGSGQIKTTGAFTVDSKQEATLKVSSNTVSVKMAGAEVAGMKVDVKSNTVASVNGSAMVEIKGALVKIN